MSAAFLCAELEITNTPRADHAQYCSSWVSVLKGDTKAVFTAASLATRAVVYLNNLQPKADVFADAPRADLEHNIELQCPSRPPADEETSTSAPRAVPE